MRLINTQTLQFESFYDSEVPPYAILSHRWGKEEVTFEDMDSASRDARQKKGYAKLKGFCDTANSLDHAFAWADTCCINKSNNTELSEAINSMYRWYSDASTCIVYLEDVGPGQKSMDQSEWFERAWTLQELIAPATVLFYNHEWDLVGRKDDLVQLLETITGIPEKVMSGAANPSTCSVAQRMSWAANRKAERVEDRAYSLLGLFDVSLPMIYGEREKAFLRLQEAIIGKSDDESIFAWSLDLSNHPQGYSGLFAPSPTSFAACGNMIRTPGSFGFSPGNTGLSIKLKTFPYSMETYLAFLHCRNQKSPNANTRYAILIARLPTNGQYARVMNAQGVSLLLSGVDTNSIVRELRIRQNLLEPPLNITYGFWIRTLQPPGHDQCQIRTLSRVKSIESDHVSLPPGSVGTAAIVSLEPTNKTTGGWSRIRWIKFGFDHEFNPLCLLIGAEAGTSQYDTRSLPNATSFEAAAASPPGSAEYEAFFKKAWPKASATTKTAPSKTAGWPTGFYVVKGNRTTGLNMKLDGLNLQISMRLQPDLSPMAAVANKEGSGGSDGVGPPSSSSSPPAAANRKIWVVDLTDTGGSSPEWDRRKFECNLCVCYLFGTAAAFCGMGCCMEDAHRMRREGQY